METHTLTTSDGLRLHAETIGRGPSMLMCNGLFCTTQYFVSWREHFGQSYRLVQFDYRSHGRSDDDPEPSRVTIERLVDDAALVLEKLCDEPTIVVGHSMGVRVALELYRRHPERISTLLLLCGSVFDSLGGVASLPPVRHAVVRVLDSAGWLGPLARGIKDVAVHQDLVSKVGTALGGLSAKTPRAPVDALLAHLDRLDVRMMVSLARSYIHHSSEDILPRVKVPTLFMVGQKDSLAPPSHARKVAALLPDVQQVVIQGCMHLAPVEKPDEVHQVVERFLARISRR